MTHWHRPRHRAVRPRPPYRVDGGVVHLDISHILRRYRQFPATPHSRKQVQAAARALVHSIPAFWHFRTTVNVRDDGSVSVTISGARP